MIPLVKPYLPPREVLMPRLEEILYSGYIAEGQVVYDFEDDLKQFLGNPHVLAVQSGTAALHIALSLLNIGPGDEVISTPMTAEPTNTTIALTGAKVVWGDVDPKTGLLDPDSVRSKITERTRAIVLVHYAGMVCDMNRFTKLSQEYGIPVIEDAAHAFGSGYQGKVVGSCSRFTCYSFQAIKQLTTVDGGAIAFTNPEEVAPARKLRWFGLDKKVPRLENDITRAGFKYGMNNVTATIGRVQMEGYRQILNTYLDNGTYYDQALQNVPGVTLVPYYPDTQPSYWLYTMKVEQREQFIQAMEAAGITASPLHHRSDTHSVFSASRCELPGMEEFYSHFVHIPCGWWVDQETRETIVNAIKAGW